MRTLATLMLAVLPGCMAPTLWPVRGEVLDLSERHEQRFTVTAAGVQVDDLHDYDGPPTSSLLVEAKRLAGSCVYLLDTVVRDTSWFRLEFPNPHSATAATELLTAQPLGRVDRSAIHLEWARDDRGYEFWQGRIEIRGELARSWRNARIGAAAAARLETAAASVRPADVADPELRECVATAESIDWRLLLPDAADGRGIVTACVPHDGVDGCRALVTTDVDLLVRVGLHPPHDHLRVAAAAVPMLAAVRRDSDTLLDRFVFASRCRTRATTAPAQPLAALGCATTLDLVSTIEVHRPRLWWLERNVLEPATEVVDWILAVIIYSIFPQLAPHEEGKHAPHRRGR